MKKKIYIHYEDEGIESITQSVWIGSDDRSDGIIESVLGSHPLEGRYQLVTSSGDRLASYEKLFDWVENKDDCFIVKTSSSSAAADSEKISSNRSDKGPVGGDKGPVGGDKGPVGGDKGPIGGYKEAVTEIETLISKRSFRKAGELCERVLSHVKPNDTLTLEYLTHVYFASGKYEKAISAGEQALRIITNSSSSQPRPQLHLIIAQSYRENEDFEEALDQAKEGVAIIKSAVARSKGRDSQLNELYLDLNAEVTRILFTMGRHMEAGDHVNTLMTGNNLSGVDPQSHVGCLLAYGEIAAQYDKVPEAMQAGLKAVVAAASDKRAKRLISDLLSRTGGLDELYRQAPPSDKAPGAYAFLAMACKDNGCLTTSEALLRRVLSIEGSLNTMDIHNHALNLVHVLESECDYISAVRAIVEHMQAVGRGKFACAAEVDRQKLGSLADVLTSALSTASTSSKRVCLWYPPIVNTSTAQRVIWISGTATRDGHDVDGHCRVVPADSDNSQAQDLRSVETTLSPSTLDLLAMAFTAVKILYTQGNIDAIPSLISIIEPLRRMSKTPVHETSVRNEHAYYLCICQLLARMHSHDYAYSYIHGEGGDQSAPLFVCGDSHCLSSAWGGVSFSGGKRTIVPKLVTGLKQYHLRPQSNFYTKECFTRTMASIPDGSDVVFLIGEIDCREGLLVAVERGRYATLEEGMRATVSIFKSVVANLVKKRKFKVYIHPILPVLDVTRDIVAAFNPIYKQAMTSITGVKWLDFYDDLITADGKNLRDDMKMDGTHVSPAYVRLMEEAFQKVN